MGLGIWALGFRSFGGHQDLGSLFGGGFPMAI